MKTERTFIDDIKHQYKHGGTTIRLIFVNVIIFLTIRILEVFSDLGGMPPNWFSNTIVNPVFGLPTKITEFITHPWTLFTSIFTHYSLFHLLFNMIFLYFAGRMFTQLFDKRRLIYTYILGGVAGGMLEILAHSLFPKLSVFNDIVIGASGAIMAIFIAIAFYRPQIKVNFFGIFPVRIIILAVVFILMDLLDLGKSDGTAHFAHLGGAIFGIVSIQNLQGHGNIINRFQRLMHRFPKIKFTNNSRKMKVKKGGRTSTAKSDEEYNLDSKLEQERIDKILDKISKSGYESLTKKEKEFLFNKSKNGQ